MPLIHLITSAEAPAHTDTLLRDLSALLARELGKPEAYVMTLLETDARMTFGGSIHPACHVEVKNVGTFGPELTQLLSRAITDRVSRALGVPSNRIYIEYVEASPHLWGHDGSTFA